MWSFILTDLSGIVLGELTNAGDRKVVDPWMRVPTASCSIPLWHPLADSVMNTDTLLKCYRTEPTTGTRTLAFHGPVLTAEETASSDAQSIGISAVGPMSRMSSRLLEVTSAGIAFGTTNSPIDLSLIGKNIIDTANGRGETGISTSAGDGAVFVNTGQTAATGKWFLKVASEALAEIAGGLNSFEWRVRPTEPAAGGSWPRIAVMDFAPETTFAVVRQDAIYEYGTSRANAVGYSRRVSRETMLNAAYISVSGWPDTPAVDNGVTQGIGFKNDTASIAARGRFEGVVADGGVIPSALRGQIAQFNVDFRKNPRQQITFSPAPNARPAPYVDYVCGEQVRARAVVRGVTRFDALFRVWGISFDIDAQGSESIEIELISPSS